MNWGFSLCIYDSIRYDITVANIIKNILNGLNLSEDEDDFED